MSFDVDLLIIGAGSGGLAAARRAVAYGAKVAVAERIEPGGACVNYGCIPEKLLDYAATFNRSEAVAASYGWQQCDRHFDWANFVAAKEQHIQHLNQLHAHHLEDEGVRLIRGSASFIDPHTVRVADDVVTSDKILIAVGAKPAKPDIPGIEHSITWHELYHRPQQPQKIAIIGSDPIGVKIAGSLSALGSDVTQITAENHILSQFDAELATVIQERLCHKGVRVLTNTDVRTIERFEDCIRLTLNCTASDPSIHQSINPSPHSFTVDTVLMDAPRMPDLTNLHLETIGLHPTAAGAIWVDEFSRTTQTNIFAIGDCTERIPLTPSAIAQGRAFADTEFGGKPQTTQFDWVPISISSQPEAATVGLSESQAREKFGDAIVCYRTQFRPLFYCLSGSDDKTLLKVVVNQQDSQRVIGLHMVGDGAVEIIQCLAVALKLGLTKPDLDSAIGIHPSTAEELFCL